MAEPTVNLPDEPALSGPAASWAPGESVSGMPSGDGGRKEVTSKLADVQREKVAASDKVYGEIDAAQSRLMPRIEQLSKDAGVEAEKMKPWDADAESAKRRTDPIVAFGSLASVAGILASAFTHAPMENALNASAAALQAIKAGDDQSYNRAAKAWEDNQKMYMDRHKIQHDAYQDAVSLLNVNMQAANTKLHVLAARFGDKQVQTLLEAGMSKEVEEVIAARNKNAMAMSDNMPKMLENNRIMSRYLALGGDPKNPQTEASQKAWETLRQEQVDFAQAERAFTPEQQAFLKFKKEKPNATAEETADYIQRLRTRAKELTPEQTALNTFMEQNPDATADDIKKFVTEMKAAGRGGAGAGGNQNLTIERQVAAEAARLKKEKMDAGMPEGQAVKESMEEASKLRRAAAAPSGNKLDQMKSLYDRAGMMSDTIDKADALLAKHKGLTGLGGTVTRPMEAVSNVFGSNETDRAQFRRYVSELQEWGSRVLNESAGRPLSAEVSKLAAILPGLSMRDTTANTVRAYRELKPLIATIQAQLKKRMDGTWDSSTSPGAGNASPDDKSQPWLRDKKVGQ